MSINKLIIQYLIVSFICICMLACTNKKSTFTIPLPDSETALNNWNRYDFTFEAVSGDLQSLYNSAIV